MYAPSETLYSLFLRRFNFVPWKKPAFPRTRTIDRTGDISAPAPTLPATFQRRRRPFDLDFTAHGAIRPPTAECPARGSSQLYKLYNIIAGDADACHLLEQKNVEGRKEGEEELTCFIVIRESNESIILRAGHFPQRPLCASRLSFCPCGTSPPHARRTGLSVPSTEARLKSKEAFVYI